jgi:hypothetical protein
VDYTGRKSAEFINIDMVTRMQQTLAIKARDVISRNGTSERCTKLGFEHVGLQQHDTITEISWAFGFGRRARGWASITLVAVKLEPGGTQENIM